MMSKGGTCFFLTFVDDFSKKVWVHFLAHKSEVFLRFKTWRAKVENHTGRKIKVLWTDNEPEFRNSEVDQFCDEHEIQCHFMMKKTPQKNGVAERMNCTITEKSRCMQLNAGLPKEFWVEVLHMAVYLINKLPNLPLDGKVAEEVWTSNPVDYSTLHIFGCLGYILIPADERSKLDLKSKRCILLFYGDGVKGCRLWDLEVKKIMVRRDVVFDGKVAEEVWTSNPVDYSTLHYFGCLGYILIPADERSKLDLKSKRCIILFYGDGVKGCRLWDLEVMKIMVLLKSSHVERHTYRVKGSEL